MFTIKDQDGYWANDSGFICQDREWVYYPHKNSHSYPTQAMAEEVLHKTMEQAIKHNIYLELTIRDEKEEKYDTKRKIS